MDGSTAEHSSDSESGESWTLLDNSPAYADEVPEFSEKGHVIERDAADTIIEKDEDTDGISIITDSDPESLTPCEIRYEQFLSEKNCPTEQHDPNCISVHPIPSNNNDHHESIRSENDFLIDNHGKHKTYVHRRNKRLSTVLNIIMLGSVITAAGVAIGHMWGARNECTVHTTPSVNKILSNLYKLQEENAYLRNKLKELTLANNLQMQQTQPGLDKIPHTQHRCKKIYEDSLNNKNANKAIKCIDNDNIIDGKIVKNHLIQPAYEQEFLNDLEKINLTYQQNKSWLDEEIGKRIKGEKHALKRIKSSLKSTNLLKIDEEQKDSNLKDVIIPESDLTTERIYKDTILADFKIFDDNSLNVNENELSPNKKISYADSVKSDHQSDVKRIHQRESKGDFDDEEKEKNKKKMKKTKNNIETTLDSAVSEDELKKDDRYVGRKIKQERKKRDRQKSHKKQKRKNKYDLWEIKGDFMMKDYDDYSVTSSQENVITFRKPDKDLLGRDFEKNKYIRQFRNDNIKSLESFEIINKKGESYKHPIEYQQEDRKNAKDKEFNWYDKRSALRSEARKRLERELFGETSPNNASWYFRRMQKREQCRAKWENSTHRKLSKRNMNYKMKH